MLNSPKNSARKEIAPIVSPAPGLAGGEGATDSSALRAEAPFAGDFDLYRPILDEAPEGVALLDGKGDILRASSGFALMTGFEPESLEGRDAMPILGLGIGQLQTLLRRGKWRGKAALKRRDGSRLPVELSLAARSGPEGARTYLAIAVDPERTREEEAELQRLAFYDTLTGLPNRALFQDRLAVALGSARRANRRLALLFLDLDNFKHVNDSLGHHAGDLLLVEVAKRLGSAVRGSDTVCRLGGDEFTVILEEISTSADASIVARKVISALEPPFLVEGREIFMGGSVGIALYPFDGTELSTLVKRADAAMYEAKERGRGQYRFASGSSGSVSDERIRAESDIRTGLEREEFEAWFQPQFSLGDPRGGTGPRIVGAEALARWRTRGGVQPPAGFISVAEETGLIIPLGARMLEESCREARRWADAGRPIPVSVNVSSLQFKRGVVVEQVKAALGASGLDPRLLVLEITESIFARDFADMAMIMLELKSFGVRFSVDDFGTGYSALSYIDRLPVDALKIDRAFVERIRSRFEGVEIATAVVAMARAFGLESVAEGVETEAQLDALRSRGCDIGQGFLLGRPMPAADFLRALLGESPPELDEPLAAG